MGEALGLFLQELSGVQDRRVTLSEQQRLQGTAGIAESLGGGFYFILLFFFSLFFLFVFYQQPEGLTILCAHEQCPLKTAPAAA